MIARHLGQLLENRFLRFLLVGGLNTLFGYGVFALCLWLGLHYAVAAAISTILGILFNFRTTGALVFRNRDGSLLWRFLCVYAVTYVVGVLCLRAASRLHLDLFVVGAVLLLPMAILSFLLSRAFVFGAAVRRPDTP